jgi:RGM family protein
MEGSPSCTYQGRPEVTHCSFYGDPHLVTFNGDFQTCKVAGAWPLIDNAYLAVSVTNEAVVPGSSATATTKVNTRTSYQPKI